VQGSLDLLGTPCRWLPSTNRDGRLIENLSSREIWSPYMRRCFRHTVVDWLFEAVVLYTQGAHDLAQFSVEKRLGYVQVSRAILNA
jgi:hypothetical protein